jgi:hypothetical protein
MRLEKRLNKHLNIEQKTYTAKRLQISNKPKRTQGFLKDSVEIRTRCNFVIVFIIPKFIEGSTCFEGHAAHHQEL